MKPVMYLDVDDVLLTFHQNTWLAAFPGPHTKISRNVVAAPGAKDFFLWALETYEVRWLTSWAGVGTMPDEKVLRLAKALDVEPELVSGIRGLPWVGTGKAAGGIDWDEYHAGRPFIWVEDGLCDKDVVILAEHKAGECYWHCNTTEDPRALRRLHFNLMSGGIDEVQT